MTKLFTWRHNRISLYSVQEGRKITTHRDCRIIPILIDCCLFFLLFPALTWRMDKVRDPRWRAAPPVPASCCRTCRNAASRSFTGRTATLRCRPSLCRGTPASRARGAYRELQCFLSFTWILLIIFYILFHTHTLLFPLPPLLIPFVVSS